MASPNEPPFQPAMPAPPGVIPNYENPEDKSGQVFQAGYACTFVALALVAIRAYTKIWITKSVGADDYTVFLSMAGSIVFMAVTFKCCEYGVGMHMWEVPFTSFSPWFMIYNVVGSSVYMFAICCAKLSIAAFFLKLSPERKFKRAVYVLAGFIVLYCLVNTIFLIFACRPISATWDMTILDSKCVDRNTVLEVLSYFNIITDFILLFLPVHILIPLTLPKRQKIGLFAIFMSGAFVCAVAIVRTVLLKQFTDNPDATYTVATQFVWAFVEINVGICCACFPNLKPFLKRHVPFLVGGGLSSGHGKTSYNTSKKMRSQSYPLSSMNDDKHARMHTSTNIETGDNTSTEEIFGKGELGRTSNDQHIMRTTEVNIEYGR